MSVRHNGVFTEYKPSPRQTQHTSRPSHNGTHSGYVRNHGTNYALNMNSVYSHNRYDRSEYNRYDRDDNYSRYDRECNCHEYQEPKKSFGQKLLGFIGKSLPWAVGIGAALVGPQLLNKAGGLNGIIKGIGGFIGKLFGKTETPAAEVKSDDKTPANSTLPAEEKKDETKAPPIEAPLESAVQVGNSQAPGTTKDCLVDTHDTIFTILQKEKPEATREELLKLTEKTIEANKELLEGNLKLNAKYTKAGDLVYKGNSLKLILD